MNMNRVMKVEEKFVWLDEEGIQCSPMHDTLGAAVRHKGSWKPYGSGNNYRKNYGSTKVPRSLTKIRVDYVIVPDPTVDSISEAFAKSDEQETDE